MTVHSMVLHFARAAALGAALTILVYAVVSKAESSLVATATVSGCTGAVMVDGKDGIIINRPPLIYVCQTTA